MTPLPVTVFADFTCPFSYLTEATLWRMPASDVELRFRAYELFPSPTDVEPHGYSATEWSEIERLGKEAGVVVRPREERPRTAKAHEAAAFAREHGAEIEMRRAVYAAYWEDARDIGRIDVLSELARDVGLDSEDARIALDIDRYRGAVRDDTAIAARLRIPGTPAIFLGTGPSARIVVGAHPANVLRDLVNDALRSRTNAD